MRKKPIVSVSYENERISIKNSLPYLKCVTSLLCGPRADLWPFYGFFGKRFSLINLYIERKPPLKIGKFAPSIVSESR